MFGLALSRDGHNGLWISMFKETPACGVKTRLESGTQGTQIILGVANWQRAHLPNAGKQERRLPWPRDQD